MFLLSEPFCLFLDFLFYAPGIRVVYLQPSIQRLRSFRWTQQPLVRM